MGAFSNYLEEKIVEHFLRNNAITPPTTVYVALFESDPDVIANAADRQMAHVRTFQTGPNAAHSQRLLNELAAAKVCLLNAKETV